MKEKNPRKNEILPGDLMAPKDGHEWVFNTAIIIEDRKVDRFLNEKETRSRIGHNLGICVAVISSAWVYAGACYILWPHTIGWTFNEYLIKKR